MSSPLFNYQEQFSPQERTIMSNQSDEWRDHFSMEAPTYHTMAIEFRELYHATIAAANLSLGDHILDIGCGRGYLTRLYKSVVGVHGIVLGLDLSPGMVQVARGSIPYPAVPRLAFHVQDCFKAEMIPRVRNFIAKSTDGRSALFDRINISHVWDYLLDDDNIRAKLLSFWFLLLAPNGLFIINMANGTHKTPGVFTAFSISEIIPHPLVRERFTLFNDNNIAATAMHIMQKIETFNSIISPTTHFRLTNHLSTLIQPSLLLLLGRILYQLLLMSVRCGNSVQGIPGSMTLRSTVEALIMMCISC
jgi:SAM-dependent methyltransferase